MIGRPRKHFADDADLRLAAEPPRFNTPGGRRTYVNGAQITVTLRLSRSRHRQLTEAAQSEGRSLSEECGLRLEHSLIGGLFQPMIAGIDRLCANVERKLGEARHERIVELERQLAEARAENHALIRTLQAAMSVRNFGNGPELSSGLEGAPNGQAAE
jgi:hypothetical protein